MGTGSIIGITVAVIVAAFAFTIYMLRKSGAFGMSKDKQQQAMQLMQTGRKARATITAIQPTGMVVNLINIQCNVHFQLQPLAGGQPFDNQKTMLISQTSMPRIGDVWPSWYDPMDSALFAVGQPTALTPEQVALFREFGIPHPLDSQMP